MSAIRQDGKIEQACLRLCNAFAHHLDQAEFDELAALFAEDAIFVRNGERLESRAAIRAAYARRPLATTAHLVSNVHLTHVEEDNARGGSAALVIHAMGVSDQVLKFEPSSAMRVLIFEDRYRLTAEGWRFSYRHPRALLESPTWPGV